MKHFIFIILFGLCLSNCQAGDVMVQKKYEQKIRTDINSLLTNNENSLSSIRQYFDNNKIEYEVWDYETNEFSRIDDMLDINDIALFAIYLNQKKRFTYSSYFVYITFNSDETFKNMKFDVFYTRQ